MEPVHLHLFTNHVPIVGAFFGALVLVIGILRKSPPTLTAAYWIFFLSATLSLVAYLSGEGAEHAVENLAGVTHDLVESHEDIGKFTLVGMILVGIISIFGLIRSKNHYGKIKSIAILALALSLASFGIGAYTAYTGGLIRHTEIRSGAAATTQSEGEQPKTDND
jgi:uncharacterized membrane protein